MKDIHIPRVFMCDQCDNTELKEEYLKRHIKFNHDGFCYNCVMNVTLHQNVLLYWQSIIKVLMKVFFYQCDQCDYRCGYRSNF